MRDRITISEIYGPVIQGEGAVIGKPTVFVRTGGCDYRCSWCDSPYAVLPEFRGEWRKMSAGEIFDDIRELSAGPILVTLSGGNPALQPLEKLIDLGRSGGYTFAIETQGTVSRDWFAKLDYLTLSPKPPSSGMRTDWAKLEQCLAAAGAHTVSTFKVVVFDDEDYDYAREAASRFPGVPMYLQVGNDDPPGPDTEPEPDVPKLLGRYAWLSDRVLADGWHTATVLPQLHVLIYGNRRAV